MIKKTLMFAIGIICALTTFGQKNGYKDVEIGKTLDFVLDKYEVRSVKDNEINTYYISGEGHKICGLDIEDIIFTLDETEKINLVKFSTKEFTIIDFKDYLKKIDNFSAPFIDNLGNPTKVLFDQEDSNNNSMFWRFKDDSLTLGFSIENIPTLSKDLKRRFTVIWMKDKKTKIW